MPDVRHWLTMRTPDEIRISNRATYWPVAPIDLVIGAPWWCGPCSGHALGRVVQAAVLGAYLGSAVRDWHDRRGIRRIDFRREFGADLLHLVPMPREAREAEVRTLAERLNDEFVLGASRVVRWRSRSTATSRTTSRASPGSACARAPGCAASP